ncbi:MAG: TonB-dependent receptor, partial [Bacteroidota bacterium]
CNCSKYNNKRGDGFRPNSGFESHHAYAHIGYQLSAKTQLTAELTYLYYLAQQAGGLTDVQFDLDPTFSNRTRNWFSVDWLLYSARLEHRFSSATNASLQFFGLDAARKAVGFRTNRVSQVDDLSSPRDLLIGEFNNWGLEGRLLHRYTLGGKRAIWLIGSKWYSSENTALQGPGTNSSAADFSLATEFTSNYAFQSDFQFPNRNLALFSENIFYLNDRLSITPGLRYEYIRTRSDGTFRSLDRDLAGNVIRDSLFVDQQDFARNILLAGVGMSYQPRPELEIYANFSQNFRSVTFSDIRIVNPSDQIDPNISDERGFTADVGIRGQTNAFVYELNAFGLLYDDRLGEVIRPRTRITPAGEEVEVPGLLVRWRGNIGGAFIFGLESLFDWNLLHKRNTEGSTSPYRLNYFLNLAVAQSEYFRSEIPNVVGKQVEFIPLVNLKTGLRFGWKNLLGSLQFTYLSEQFTDATNAPRDRNDNLRGIIGSIPAYALADLSLSYQFKKWLKLEAGANNLTNEQYFTRRATGYPGPGISPSEPRTFYCTIGVSW